jgi:2-iminobutanoate/2-iminopropanoate deaminase
MKRTYLFLYLTVVLPICLLGQTTPPSVPYSKAIETNGFLFISGHLGTKDGKLMDETFETEAHQSMQNIKEVLTDKGLTFDDVVSVIIYLKDMNDYDRLNAVYRTYFTTRFPTRTCIQVAALPRNGHVEISATAVIPKKKNRKKQKP